MTETEYRKAEGISQTQVNYFLKSPALYEAMLTKKVEPTPAMILGSYFDSLLTGEDVDRFYVAQLDGRTKEGKAEREAKAGKTILSKADAEDCQRWAECTMLAAPQYINAEVQVALFGEIDGVKVKGKLDAICDGTIVDYKLLADASPEKFGRICVEGYDIQAAMYQTLYGQSEGITSIDELCEIPFVFVCQEKHDLGITPKFTGLYRLNWSTLYAAHNTLRRALAQIKTYESMQVFPGYGSQEINPKWGRGA